VDGAIEKFLDLCENQPHDLASACDPGASTSSAGCSDDKYEAEYPGMTKPSPPAPPGEGSAGEAEAEEDCCDCLLEDQTGEEQGDGIQSGPTAELETGDDDDDSSGGEDDPCEEE
jgi:hypothetical protein